MSFDSEQIDTFREHGHLEVVSFRFGHAVLFLSCIVDIWIALDTDFIW